MKKDIKQFLLQKETEKWVKENKELLDDYRKLCEDLLFFEMKWGINIGFVFNNRKEIKGRELGKGIIEEIDDMQKFVNKKML
ncbi:hypothetical protein M0R04_13650 [Candidatus Dojkabacteria bacterium]|jgi:hypothetical protein|nr:hypothetical protein [Candidatus Dojkabacteria bacterium]